MTIPEDDMKPAVFNERQFLSGKLPREHIQRMMEVVLADHPFKTTIAMIAKDWSRLTSDWTTVSSLIVAWQSLVGLTDDGMFGPESLRRYTELYDAGLPHPGRLALELVNAMKRELGNGEEFQNNAGPHLHRYRDYPYGEDPMEFSRPIGEWCEFLVNYCARKASLTSGIPLPFSATFYDESRNRQMPIGSAKQFGRRVGETGQFVEWGKLIIGDILVWDRGKVGSPAGHIEVVAEIGNQVTTIAGNVGEFPALVKRRTYSRSTRPARLEFAARLRP